MRLSLLPRELHTTDRPSATAQWTTLGRALELERPRAQRIVSDEFAPLFLTPAARNALSSLQAARPLAGLVHAAERHELAGVSAFALCRHRFVDEHLHIALDDGAEQVLILGAGYDSRAYRFADELRGRPVHEVDLPPLSRRKAGIVAAHPARFGHTAVRRVEIDFRTESLAERLLGSGFAVGARTFVVWEGVSMYLDAASVAGTLDMLRDVCGPGSVVAMDFWDGVGGPGRWAPVRRLGARAIAVVGEPVVFGLRMDEAGDYLAEHGSTVIDLVGAAALADRYSTDGRPSEKSVYVLAARLG